MALYQARAKAILDHIHAVAAMAALTGGLKLRLFTAGPTITGGGTEVTGGGYTAGGAGITMGAAVNGANPPTALAENSAAVSYTNMPAATVTHIDTTDSAATPVPQEFGALASSKTTAAGDTLSFAIGAVDSTLS